MHLQKPPPAPRSKPLVYGCDAQEPAATKVSPLRPGQKHGLLQTHLYIMARRGINRSFLFTTQSNTKASPFPSLRVHSKRKPNCALGGTVSKTRLAGSTGEYWRAAPARYWPDTRQDPPARDTQRDTRRDPLLSYSVTLSGILGGMLGGGIPLRAALGGIHWRAALAGYSAGSTGEPLWRDTRRDPLESRSGGILGGIHWRAALAGYSAGSTGEQLSRYSAGSTKSTGEQLWRDTGRDPPAAAVAGYSAGSTGKPLWRDTGWGHGVEASQTRIPT